MSNTARNTRQINDVIVLTNAQADLYRYDCLTLKTRDGKTLDVIQQHTHDLQEVQSIDNKQDAINKLRFLEVVMANQSNGIELDESAAAGLSDLITDILFC